MNRIIPALLFTALVSLSSIGCTDTKKADVKQETKINGPGGTTTITTEKEVKTTGKNPPVAP